MSHDLAPGERAPIPLRPLETDIGRSTAAPFFNLPGALTSLIGRDDDVAVARALLVERRPRLITLTGAGGVGKTRLALQVAEEVAPAFPDGVVFVPLAPITDPELVLSAIARVIGIHEMGNQTVVDLLVSHLHHRRLLLVLDNFEQVLAAAPLVAALLGDCPGLTVLTASRSRLHISGERCFRVAPLALPEAETPDGSLPLAAVAASPAVQLFVERAQAVNLDFTLSESNAQVVGKICRRLDGLPLAIELAAVRLQLLSPAELLDHLNPAFPLLTEGPADAPARLRTMRNAIAWSYDLLCPAAQTLLQRMSVFVGGCTVEAATWIGGRESEIGGKLALESASCDGHPPTLSTTSGTLDTIAALIDASLVQRQDSKGESRLAMMETIRDFALEHLVASGERDTIAARHAAWCTHLAETVRRSGGHSHREGLDRLEADHPNFRAALMWFLATGREEAALHLAGELAEFWFRRAYLAEGIAWFERTLDADTGPPTAARATALVGLSLLLWPKAAHVKSQRDPAPAGDEADGFPRLWRLLDEAEMVARAAADAGALAFARLHQGYVALLGGDYDLAEARGREARESVASIPQGFGPNGPTWLLAEAALARGDDALAHRRFTQLAGNGEDEISQVNALTGLARLAARRGEPGQALRGFAAAATLSQRTDERLKTAFCLEQVSVIAAATGRAADAIRLYAAAAPQRDVTGIGLVRIETRDFRPDQVLAAARAAVGEAAFATYWSAGAALSLDEAIAEIEALADRVIAAAPTQREGQHTDAEVLDRDALHHARESATRGIADSSRRAHTGNRQPIDCLSAREREVLHLLVDGLADKAIAATLGISRRTASNHVAAILTKLEVESRTAAVSRALRQGWLDSARPDASRLRKFPPAT